jgi:hypothetical protein
MDEDVKQLILSSAAETRRHVEAVGEETRRHFDIVAEDLRHQIQLTMEGVVANRGAIDQLRDQMKEEFVELASMIRISYGQLDRRLRTLEEIVSGLLTRVDRLESASTQ